MLLNPDQQQQQNHQHHQQQLQQMALQAGPSELDPAYAQFRDQTRFWIQRVAVPLLMVIGLFGNSITVIIMTRRRMRSTTNMYLAALAFVDMLYLVLTFLLGLSHYPNMAGHKYYAYWKLRPFLMMLTDACSNTSVWLTVTFTIERYIAVKYPMKGILFASPVPFEWKVIEKRLPMVHNAANGTSIAFKSELAPNQDAITRPSIDHANVSAGSDKHEGSNNNNTDIDQHNSGGYGAATGSGFNSDSIGGNGDSDTGVRNTSGSLGEIDTELLAKAATAAEKVGGNMVTTDDSYILALDYSDFGKNETYKTIYYWSTAVIFYFIPLFSLMLFNGFLIKSVHQSQRERTKMTRPSTSSTQSSMRKTDIDITVNGSVWNQPLMKPQKKCSARKFKLLRPSSGSREKDIPKDSTTIEESAQNPPTFEYSGAAKKNDLEAVCLMASQTSPEAAEAAADVASTNNQTTVRAAEAKSHAAGDTSELTIENKSFSELNVQINCDNESATNERSEENEDHNLKPIQMAFSQTSSIMDPKETVKTIGVPQARYSPLRRSQMTNSSSRSQHSMVPASTQERRITIMLIAVVILFLVCQIPSAAMLLYTSVHELVPNTNEHALVLAFGNIFNFLMAVNAAGNFILYSFLSKKYRRTFMILFCSCLKAKQKHTEPRRVLSVRFESSGSQLQRNSSSMSIYQNNKTSDKVHRDTLV